MLRVRLLSQFIEALAMGVFIEGTILYRAQLVLFRLPFFSLALDTAVLRLIATVLEQLPSTGRPAVPTLSFQCFNGSSLFFNQSSVVLDLAFHSLG